MSTKNHSQVPAAHLHITQIQPKSDFFAFEEDEEDTSSTAENQVADYIRSSAKNGEEKKLIKKISLRYNAATPSSAPVERQGKGQGKLVFSPKRNRQKT